MNEIGKRLIVSLLWLLLFVPAMQAGEIADEADLDRVVVSFAFDDVSLRAAFQELIAQTNLQIVYSDALVDSIKVNNHSRNVTLRQALEKLLRNTDLSYKVMKDGQIVIVRYRLGESATVKGFVRDAATGETLPYANVFLAGGRRGTASNVHGYFVLPNVPSGLCTLQVKYIGYQPLIFPVTVHREMGALQLVLHQQALPGEEVLVSAENAQNLEVAAQPGEMRISPRLITGLPAIGETDIFRALQLLPGISGVHDGSSGLYVRGGTPSENLVLFDGMTIYHVDHLFGFISAFNTEAVKDVRVFKGGFPASFGGRVSSVVELTGKTGSYQQIQAGASLNLLSGSGIAEVPLRGRGALLLSFRRSYTDYLRSNLYDDIYGAITGQHHAGNTARPAGGSGALASGTPQANFTPDFYYYDMNAKLSLTPTPKDLLFWSFYAGRDYLDQTQPFENAGRPHNGAMGNQPVSRASLEDQTSWGNTGASWKWARFWNDRINTNSLLAYSVYRSNSHNGLGASLRNGNTLEPAFSSREDNTVRDLTFRMDTEWQAGPAHKVAFGSWLSRTTVQLNFTVNDTIRNLFRDDRASQYAFYAQDSWQATPVLNMTLGLRTTYYAPTRAVYYEPRLSARLQLGRQLWLRGAWGKYDQFINRIVNENVLRGNRDFWLLADERLKPSRAAHHILGMRFETTGYLFDVEAYWKNLDGVAEFSQRFHRSPDAQPEKLFFLGDGVAKGIEFMLQKKAGRYDGWASYTLAKVSYRFPALNNGEPFPADQDRRHEIKLAGTATLGKWQFAAVWIYTTGTPYTVPAMPFDVSMPHDPNRRFLPIGPKNGERLPAYHRLDLSLRRRITMSRFSWDFGLSIFNLYDHVNIWYRQYSMETSQVTVRDVTTLGLTPTLSISVRLR